MQSPPERKVEETRWVLVAKRNGEGVAGSPKVWLVAKGSTQIEFIDFQEVCSPVSLYETVCLVMSVSVKRKQERRLPVGKNAFVNATLKETTYVIQRNGFME